MMHIIFENKIKNSSKDTEGNKDCTAQVKTGSFEYQKILES